VEQETFYIETSETGTTSQSQVNQIDVAKVNNSDNLSVELELMRQDQEMKQHQRENEINTAIRCLTTNLIICFVFIICVPLELELNCTLALGLAALLKVFVPIIATASNFVKINTLMIETFSSFKSKFLVQKIPSME
jgi:hypothetical protein